MDLPSKKSFYINGDIDSQHAWQIFGGKTIDEAKNIYQRSPDVFLEDFASIKTNAYIFYFSAIVAYIQEIEPSDPYDDCYLPNIATLIKMRKDVLSDSIYLERIKSLTNFVLVDFIQKKISN